MVAARTRLEIATENLANVSTDGFRRVAARGFLTALGVTIARERHGETPGSSVPPASSASRTERCATPPGIELPDRAFQTASTAIAEMIDVLAAERSFESAQKAVTAIDLSRQKAAEAARIS